MIITLTGYTGFLGQKVLDSLKNRYHFRLLSRDYSDPQNDMFDINIGDDVSQSMNGCDIVIHCAARAHVMNEYSSNPWEEYYASNVDLTIRLAKQAQQNGVRRFIFISSLKVNGESTKFNKFKNLNKSNPQDMYAFSKSLAEQELIKLVHDSSMEIVIIRPPLVYGQGVKANFSKLFNLVIKECPLPFGAINNNRRSLVSVYNLVDLIDTCVKHPEAANQTFLVSDDYDLSTTHMVKLMAKVQDVNPWLIPVPVWMLKLLGKITGKSDMISRLTDSLQVDITHTKETLNWKPPYSVEEGFAKCVEKNKGKK